MSQLRIYVEQHPNEMVRDFHLSQPTFFKPFTKYSEKGIPKKILKWNRRLTMLPQIQDDSISGIVDLKALRVKLNPAFSWEECIEAVVGEIKRYFKTDDVLVTVMERDTSWDIPRFPDDNEAC